MRRWTLASLFALAVLGCNPGHRDLTEAECQRFVDQAQRCGNDGLAYGLTDWCSRNVGEDTIGSGLDEALGMLGNCDQLSAAEQQLYSSRVH